MEQIKTEVAKAKDERHLKAAPYAPAGQSTQMIVGATPASDADILGQSQSLYKGFKLKRVYYSAYSPIPNADALLPVRSRPSFVRIVCTKPIGYLDITGLAQKS